MLILIKYVEKKNLTGRSNYKQNVIIWVIAILTNWQHHVLARAPFLLFWQQYLIDQLHSCWRWMKTGVNKWLSTMIPSIMKILKYRNQIVINIVLRFLSQYFRLLSTCHALLYSEHIVVLYMPLSPTFPC